MTLQEIGDLYHKARSTISETCALYNIDINDINGRQDNLKKRKNKKRKQNFINVMYDKIKKEL